MKRELEKYGLQLPSFSKIGGILANELSVDEAAGNFPRAGASVEGKWSLHIQDQYAPAELLEGI